MYAGLMVGTRRVITGMAISECASLKGHPVYCLASISRGPYLEFHHPEATDAHHRSSLRSSFAKEGVDLDR